MEKQNPRGRKSNGISAFILKTEKAELVSWVSSNVVLGLTRCYVRPVFA